MPTPTQKLNDWIEYKLLVLAELERLNDCIDKLQTGCNGVNTEINDVKRDCRELKQMIENTNTRMIELHPASTPEAQWKFYAAVATLVATAITSVASLIITLWGR